MKKNTKKAHTVDFLFVITLFLLFAFSSIVIIGIGARVYQKSVTTMSENNDRRTTYLYITEKIRQSDGENSIYASTFDGQDALVLTKTISDNDYNTYLYVYDGYLMEMLIKSDNEDSVEARNGTKIMELNSFNVKAVSEDLFNITAENTSGDEESFYVYTHCSN